MFKKHTNIEGQGSIVEGELLGNIEKKDFKNWEQYCPYKEALEIVKKNQKWENPSDPEPDFANDLHATIAEKLKLENYDKLQYYSAVGSQLDKFHSVDALFVLVNNSEEKIVTIDLTTNPEKDKYKADIILQVPSEGLDRQDKEDKEKWKDIMEKYSKEIADKFLNN